MSAKFFDSNHPPKPELISECVHCGFCLSTCPSYRVLGKEMDSPRGRIYLMDAIHTQEAGLSETSVEHFDSCLGCLACTTACPSGVQYDRLIADTRNQIERQHPRSLGDWLTRQLIFQLFPYPQRLRLLLPLFWLYQQGLQPLVRRTGLLQRLAPRLAAMEATLPALNRKTLTAPAFPTIIPAQGPKRYRVGMILGCVQQIFFHPVNAATARVLSANGCEIVIPPNQGCCAALPAHQGQEEQAKVLARQTIDRFEGSDVEFIIINAAGCGHTLKEYGHILADDPAYAAKAKAFAERVRDAQEFLAEVGLTTPLSPLSGGDRSSSDGKPEELTLVYQDACHLLHGQKISVQPRQLLRQIPGIRLREPVDAALCCGSAGVYSLLQPEIASELGQQKARNLAATGAQAIASPNPGCALQIRRHLELQGQSLPVLHPLELLDLAIRGECLNL